MFLGVNMPPSASIFSAYTTFAASAMMARTVLSEVQTMTNQIIPEKLKEGLLSKLGTIFGNRSNNSQLTITIDEYNGYSVNEVYQASETYLSSIIDSGISQLKVYKSQQDEELLVTMDKGEKIVDFYEGIELHWQLLCSETQKAVVDYESLSTSNVTSVRKSFQLTFQKRFKNKVLKSYLPFVVERWNAIREEHKVVKLYSSSGGYWEPGNLDHPSTFDTLAMDPADKKELMDDLDRFLKRRKFYRRVGKAWKRGYLLYGPPGTGKSSLIAAIGNYLKFDIYDLELSSLNSNSDLRRLLVSTSNRSIIVIEDIDCSVDLQNRQNGGYNNSDSQVNH